MADLSDSITLNGVTYRTEREHERILRETLEALKAAPTKVSGQPSSNDLVIARLDALRKTIEAQPPPPGADHLTTVLARLDMIRKALEWLSRATSEGTTPLPRALTERLAEMEKALSHQGVGALEKKLGVRLDALNATVHAEVWNGAQEVRRMLEPLVARLEAIATQQQVLVDLLDAATAPPPPPARVPPRLAAPSVEVAADPTPFPRSLNDLDLLNLFLANPSMTTQTIADHMGVQRERGRQRLYAAAAQTGAMDTLRKRMRANMLSQPSSSGPAGAAPPPSMAAGSLT